MQGSHALSRAVFVALLLLDAVKGLVFEAMFFKEGGELVQIDLLLGLDVGVIGL